MSTSFETVISYTNSLYDIFPSIMVILSSLSNGHPTAHVRASVRCTFAPFTSSYAVFVCTLRID